MSTNPSAPPSHPLLAIVGGGNMASAIVRGGVASGILDLGRVVVAEPDPEKQAVMLKENIQVLPSSAEAIWWLLARETAPDTGQLLLAVKPQSLEEVAKEIGPLLGNTRRIVISILAGARTARIRELLGPPAAVIRAMPNLPAAIGKGTTAVCRGDGTSPGDEAFALALFRGIGPLVVEVSEDMMDAFTAIAGSGPAYLFYLAQAMVLAAVDLGFEHRAAVEMVRSTISGASALMTESDRTPGQLREAVTSKGGVTEAAMEVLDAAGVIDTIRNALRVARDRGASIA